MKKRIAAGLITAAIMMSAMAVPFSVSAENTMIESFSTDIVCGGFIYNGINNIDTIWDVKLYDNKDLVISANIYAPQKQVYADEPLLLGVLGYHGDYEPEISDPYGKLNISGYEADEPEEVYWENRIQMEYGRGIVN